MRTRTVPGVVGMTVLGLFLVIGTAPTRPLSADQAGGLPALEKRVAMLEQAGAGQAAEIASLKSRLGQAEANLAAVTARLVAVEGKTAPITVAGTAFTISGKNVFIQDGSGSTASGSGLGNLTIGYNALRGPAYIDDRTGTHNLILGDLNNYSSHGGLVVGWFNEISNEYASVGGGFNNTASGRFSAVSGGSFNQATNTGASVSGGSFSLATGVSASVSGGFLNLASGNSATVGGGELRKAVGESDWVAGMLFQDQ